MRSTKHAVIASTTAVAIAALLAATLNAGADQAESPAESAVARTVTNLGASFVPDSPSSARDRQAPSRATDRTLVLPAEPVDRPAVAAPAPAKVDVTYTEPLGFTGVTPAPEPEPAPAVTETAAETVPADEQAAPEPVEAESTLTTGTTETTGEPAPAPKPAPATSGGVMGIAARYVGQPYVTGGASPGGFDCSGLTQYVFAQVGISLPRTADAQQAIATPVSNPQPGDLVFWGYPAYHVGIYAGDGMVIDAGNPRTGVIYRSVFSGVSGYGRVG